MRRSTIGLLLALVVAACGGEHPPSERPGFETRRHQARLTVEGPYARLEVTGLGDLAGQVASARLPLAEQVVGTWGRGYGTEDYPSSFIHHSTLELRTDGSATWLEEEGHESFDANGDIQTHMHPSNGPWQGTWSETGYATLEIVLYVPEDEG